MTLHAAILLTLSALLHAGWNLLGKQSQPSSAFFLAANGFACLFLSPLLFIYHAALNQIPAAVWLLILITGCFQAIYMAGLAGAYRHGAISVAYPLLRSLPILFVALFAAALNQGERLTALSVLGIMMIALGCFMMPIHSLRHLKVSTFINLSCLFALLGAGGTIGYTLIDDRALNILRKTQSLELSTAEISLLYLLFESISCSFWLILPVIFTKRSCMDLYNVLAHHKVNAALTGFAMMATYFLVLTSMAYVNNVSYVVAFRQLSIPIAVIVGVYYLKEHKNIFKLAGTTAAVCGIILISIW